MPHRQTRSTTVRSALFAWDAPVCPAGGPLRDAPSSAFPSLSLPSGSGPPPSPSSSIWPSSVIIFRKAARLSLYSEPEDGLVCGFSYLPIILSRLSISSLSRSFSALRAATLLPSVASSRDTISCSSRFSATNLASPSRRRAVSDLWLTSVRRYRDQ